MGKTRVVLFTLLFAATSLCTAQQLKQDKWTVFGGYTFATVHGFPNMYNMSSLESGDLFGPFNLIGGGGSVTYYPKKYVGLTADFSFTGKNQAIAASTTSQTVREQSYLFGPEFRYTFKNLGGPQRVSVFAHQLFGVAHTTMKFSGQTCYNEPATCSANPFTMASGGGVDVRVTSHISIRPAQLDYWSQQISSVSLVGFGLATQTDSGKLGVDGLRYSAGGVIRF